MKVGGMWQCAQTGKENGGRKFFSGPPFFSEKQPAADYPNSLTLKILSQTIRAVMPVKIIKLSQENHLAKPLG